MESLVKTHLEGRRSAKEPGSESKVLLVTVLCMYEYSPGSTLLVDPLFLHNSQETKWDDIMVMIGCGGPPEYTANTPPAMSKGLLGSGVLLLAKAWFRKVFWLP